MSSSTEDELLRWLARSSPLTHRIGNDGALLEAQQAGWVATVDTQIAGVHFPPDLDVALVARRLLAVNLSDLAAMGAEPRHAFLSLTAPQSFEHKRFFESLLRALEKYGLELSGGDLSHGRQCHAVLFLLGAPVRRGHCLGRDRAKPGDQLWVGGTLGDSALGQRLVARGARLAGRRVVLPPDLQSARASLARAARAAVRRHLLPTPQLELGSWLATRRRVAALDVSDGLALDASRLAHASGVGLRIESARLPRVPGYEALSEALEEDAELLQLSGGEDYVLLFTLPRRSRPPEHIDAQRIGRVVESGDVLIVDGRGRSRPLAPAGWDHLAAARLSGRR